MFGTFYIFTAFNNKKSGELLSINILGWRNYTIHTKIIVGAYLPVAIAIKFVLVYFLLSLSLSLLLFVHDFEVLYRIVPLPLIFFSNEWMTKMSISTSCNIIIQIPWYCVNLPKKQTIENKTQTKQQSSEQLSLLVKKINKIHKGRNTFCFSVLFLFSVMYNA